MRTTRSYEPNLFSILGKKTGQKLATTEVKTARKHFYQQTYND